MPDESVPAGEARLRAANARLRSVVEAKDAEISGLRLELDALREVARRLELRLAELERRLNMDSSDSGTPSSKEGIGAKAARKAREKKDRHCPPPADSKSRHPVNGHPPAPENASIRHGICRAACQR